MKRCSKCLHNLDHSRFVKSPRYSDGFYPSCKACRKQARLKTLMDNPICSICGTFRHLKYSPYCSECNRVAKGRPAIPSRVVDRNNKVMCSRCRVHFRLEYHGYCQECKNASTRKWTAKFRTIRVPDEKRRKRSARHYINTLFKRGKVRRQPCEVCGQPSQHFHHLDYKDRTKNVQHLCLKCHIEAEREKRRLTKQQPSNKSVTSASAVSLAEQP
jgi:hypothetical protein